MGALSSTTGTSNVISGLLRPLVDQDLAVVFYDMTSIRTEELSNLGAQRLSKGAQLWFLASQQQKADHLTEVAGVQAPKWQRIPICEIGHHASCAVEVRLLRR